MDTRIKSEVDTLRNASATLAEKIAAAARLWDLQEEIKTALEGFKTDIRALPEVTTSDPGSTVTLEGKDLTRCKVTLPTPSLVLTTDPKVSDALTTLGPKDFNEVFTVTLRVTNPKQLDSLPAQVRTWLGKITKMVVHPPRVSVKSLPGVQDVNNHHG